MPILCAVEPVGPSRYFERGQTKTAGLLYRGTGVPPVSPTGILPVRCTPKMGV